MPSMSTGEPQLDSVLLIEQRAADSGGASSRAVKGGVEPPHSMTTNDVANGYEFFDLL